jgi:hypothetical protein
MSQVTLKDADPFLLSSLGDDYSEKDCGDQVISGEDGQAVLLRELLVCRFHRGGLPAIASMLCWAGETISAFHKATNEDRSRLYAAARTLRDRDANNGITA